MEFKFVKYHGSGNDFIIFDDRDEVLTDLLDQQKIENLCHRHFGIGADGLILIQNHDTADFEMVYFNADGHPSSMCGNGGRCSVHFANRLGIFEQNAVMMAVDGLHDARMMENGWISLAMRPTSLPQQISKREFFIDTGSPHFIRFVDDSDHIDVVTDGREVRYSEQYKENGVNVNFIFEQPPGILNVRTYERGVEDETLSCGTGVTAAAITFAHRLKIQRGSIPIETKGGRLNVKLRARQNGYDGIWLEGPATQVFTGTIEL